MELTFKDKLFIHENPELEEEYLRRRASGETEGMASILVTRQTPTVDRKDEKMRASGKEYRNLSLPGEKFIPKSHGDIDRRAQELRDRGYNVTKIDTNREREKIEERKNRKLVERQDIVDQLKKDKVI